MVRPPEAGFLSLAVLQRAEVASYFLNHRAESNVSAETSDRESGFSVRFSRVPTLSAFRALLLFDPDKRAFADTTNGDALAARSH